MQKIIGPQDVRIQFIVDTLRINDVGAMFNKKVTYLVAIFTTAQLVDGQASVMRIFKEKYGSNLPTTATFISGPS